MRNRARFKRNMGFVAAGLCFLLAFLCWRLSVGHADRLEQVGDMVTFRDAGRFSEGSYEQMKAVEESLKQPLPFALWTQLDHQTLTSQATQRQAQASVLLMRGESRTVLPVSAVLASDDRQGCLIDRKTAETLTGDGNAVGPTVEYDGRLYTVRGVFDAPQRTVLLQAPEDGGIALQHVTVQGAANADEFAMRHSLRTGMKISAVVYLYLAQALSVLPVVVGVFLLLIEAVKLRRRNRRFPVRSALLTAVLFAGATALVLYMLRQLPPELIPGRWSDFEFWSSTLRELWQNAVDYLWAAKYRPDLYDLSLAARACFGLLSAALLIVVQRILLRCNRQRFRPVVLRRSVPDQEQERETAPTA